MASTFESLRQTKTILLTTYKHDGTPIGTPVSIAFDGKRAFFRSYDKAWKTKRLRNDPRVEAAPCTMRGKPTGEPISLGQGCLTTMKPKRPPRLWRSVTRCCRRSSSPSATGSCATRRCITS